MSDSKSEGLAPAAASGVTALAPPSGVKPQERLEQSRSSTGAELFSVPWTPTEAMWSGLARDIMMWLDFGPRHTPQRLLDHLEMLGRDIPQWLRDEPEMKSLDHSMSKGTRCVLIYRAMLAAASVDTHAKRGGAAQTAAPSPMSGAVTAEGGQTPNTPNPEQVQ